MLETAFAKIQQIFEYKYRIETKDNKNITKYKF